MPLYLNLPQCVTGLRIALGHDRYNRPQKIFPCEDSSSASINESIEETEGNFDKLLYNTGTENGFILVKETS